jgi:ankyrin repeat protein
VFCQIEVLRGCFPPALRRALEEMPKTLDATYEQILLSIGNAKRGYAYHLLQCLAVSIRPLSVEELAEVLAIRLDDGDDSEYQCDWRPEDARQAVFSACFSLITIVNVDGVPVVQFSHFSVKEFLMSSRLANAGEHLSLYHIIPSSAHTFLSRSCLSVLLSLGDNVDSSIIAQRPFAIYAARYWVDHAKAEGVSFGVQDLMERLFDPDAPYFATWVWIYDIDRPWKGFMPTVQPTEPEAKPLYYAALCGFRSLMDHLLVTHQMGVNVAGGDHIAALNAALSRGELEISRTLLQNGANVNTVDIAGISSLYRAAQASNRAVVELLLEHQADVNLHAGQDTPLHVVAQTGELNICRLLLKHGADVSSKTTDGWTALHFASRYGQFGIVQELLVHDADVNDHQEDLWTSLHLASTRHLEIVKLLVREGAVLEKMNANHETALHVASHLGNLQIAHFLIEQGANTISKDKDGNSPLHIASRFGYLDLAEIFVGIGVDVNVRNADRETPLHLASELGHINVARVLMVHGADVNCCDKRGWTPLHTAAHNGRLDTVRLLLDHGLSVQVRNGNDETPLILASFGGHLEVSQYLIENQADVNSLSDGGWSPLHSASKNGHADVVQLLLDNGASVCIQAVDLCTPLHLASANGYLKVAELLIGRGAGVDVENEDQKTPLDLAARNGKLETAKVLIKSGSDVNSQDNLGWTPSHAAARNGHLSLVELLLNSGADADMRNTSDKTPFDLAQEHGKLDIVRFLSRRSGNLCSQNLVSPAPLEAGSQNILPDETMGQNMGGGPSSDNEESNSLHSASVNGHADVARRLLNGDADVDERNEHLQTPLTVLGSQYGKVAIAKMLIKYGADLNSRDTFGWTPLHWAARYGHIDVVQLLIDSGADVDATQREGLTALHIASGWGCLEIVRSLLERGANVQIRNAYGRTPSQNALLFGYREIAQLLSEHDVGGG